MSNTQVFQTIPAPRRAVQWRGLNVDEIQDFLGSKEISVNQYEGLLTINVQPTHPIVVKRGDWISVPLEIVGPITSIFDICVHNPFEFKRQYVEMPIHEALPYAEKRAYERNTANTQAVSNQGLHYHPYDPVLQYEPTCEANREYDPLINLVLVLPNLSELYAMGWIRKHDPQPDPRHDIGTENKVPNPSLAEMIMGSIHDLHQRKMSGQEHFKAAGLQGGETLEK
jgi:hypothetical protein